MVLERRNRPRLLRGPDDDDERLQTGKKRQCYCQGQVDYN